MSGEIFALLAAMCFAGSQVFVRRGVSQTEGVFSATSITVFLGCLFFSFLLLVTGEVGKLLSLSWQGFTLLGIAGIMHFIIGRHLNYSCLQIIGANRGSILLRTNLFYAVAFGIFFLNEPFTNYLILGVLLIALGVTLASFEGEKVFKGMPIKGILAGLGAGFCYGTSGVLIKPAIREIGSPFIAVFISYLIAALLLACFLFRRAHRSQLNQLNRSSLAPLLLGGLFISTAQLLRYTAFNYSPVSVVTPLMSAVVPFTLFFSFLLNRDIEVFTKAVISGLIATVAGALLISI